MDILGPFPKATGQRKFLLVAIDYLTKWVEAETVASITENEVRKFIWKNIVTCFRVPQTMIFNNGRQFDTDRLRSYCAGYDIQTRYTAVVRPQTNGQVESTNKQILSELKKRLDAAKGSWADELPAILWSIRTTEKGVTSETPFMLVYGSEAVLPIELAIRTHRTTTFQTAQNNQASREALNLLPLVRGDAYLHEEVAKARMARFYNRRVRERLLAVGDLVQRKMEAIGKGASQGKLTPNWEGPYIIFEEVRPGTFRLQTLQGVEIPRAWHSQNLRRYFV